MQRLILVAGIFLLLGYCVRAQKQINFKDVDSLSYKYYEELKWDSLITIGKKGLKNNIDYFYLRMRIGIAYYEKQKYRKAAIHFKKALTFNSSDDIAMEYLYFSYLFSGQKEEARALTKRFSLTLSDKLKTNVSRLFDEVHFEGGPTLGSNPVMEEKGNQQLNPNILLREEELTNDVKYFALGIKHAVSKKIFIYHSISSIDIGKTQNIEVYNGNIINDYRIFQRQYYLSSGIYLGNGFSLKPSFHYINVNYDKLIYDFDTNNKNKLFIKQERIIKNDFAASLSLTKNISVFNFELNTVMAKLNNSRQKQLALSTTVFPLNNLNFYINGTVTLHNNDLIRNIIYEPMAGCKILPKLWLDGFITIGRLYNYTEKNAYLVYNITDAIKSRKGLSLKYVLNDNITFSLHYQNLIKKNTLNMVNINNIPVIRERNNFINHTIIGGIKWTL